MDFLFNNLDFFTMFAILYALIYKKINLEKGEKWKKLAVFVNSLFAIDCVIDTFSKTVQAKRLKSRCDHGVQDPKCPRCEELATGLGRYDSFRLNAKFALEGKKC